MKTIYATLIFVLGMSIISMAQTDSTQIIVENEIEVIANDTIVNEENKIDTVNIRIGKSKVEIISDEGNAQINIEKSVDDPKGPNDIDIEDVIVEKIKNRKNRFKGHWEGFSIGVNSFTNVSYANYAPELGTFLDINEPRSYEVNFNIAQKSIGFTPWMGLVTGIGVAFNDYRFENRITLAKDETGIIAPITLPDGELKKTKLSSTTLEAPLVLEIQFKGNNRKPVYIQGGVFGGINLGSHTKYVLDDEKVKNRSDVSLNTFRYGLTGRVGIGDFSIFGKYHLSQMFEGGEGPDAQAFSIGIAFH